MVQDKKNKNDKIESQMIIIFGATGDLTRRKLIPALYHLVRKEQLTRCTPIVCLGRKKLTVEEFIHHLDIEKFIENPDADVLARLTRRIEYLQVDVEQTTAEAFKEKIQVIQDEYATAGNKLIYLALPTTMFQTTAALLKPLIDDSGWQRVVFEKPFGQDLLSATQLNSAIKDVLDEESIYRVDHYLGKELVQNILTMRFANQLFASAWCHEVIDHIQITVSERLGVEKRAAYYDASGAVRDMVQNHLLQLLSLIAMEPPKENSPNFLRDEAVNVLRSLRPIQSEDVVLGQYGQGIVGGESVPGYREEEGVPKESVTETYCAFRAWVDTPRWQGVPFYLRTGKRLEQRHAEIKVVFKDNCQNGLAGFQAKPNMIILRIQPDEGMALAFNVRRPGEQGSTESVLMDFCHHCYFGPNTPEAYESILRNVTFGDHSVFPRWDWIEASWRYIDMLREKAGKPVSYVAGSVGPKEADALLESDGRQWLNEEQKLQRFLVTTDL